MTSDDSALRTAVYVVLFVLAIPVLMMLVMMPMMVGIGWDMHTAWWGTGGGWGWILMLFVPILVLVGFGYVLYTLVDSNTKPHDSKAIDELRTAYARGDLSDEEFEHRLTRLRRNEGDDR